jgi:hypothetical protein
MDETARNAQKWIDSKKKGKWEKIKLREILGNPDFLGKTIRIGDCIFEVKGIDKFQVLKNEATNAQNLIADFAA